MVSSTFVTAVLFAATATAAPAATSAKGCKKSDEFALALVAEGYPRLSLNAEHVAAGQSALVFERPAAYPGTPACIIDNRLVFDLPGATIPASATFQSGSKEPITANTGLAGNQRFTLSNGALSISKSEPNQFLYACNTTVNNEPILGLFYGFADKSGAAPTGCVPAKLVANYNVEGGAKPPTQQ